MQYTWEYDTSADIWQHDLFDTIEECIEDAKENYNVEIGSDIAIGEAIRYEIYVDYIDILERLEEQAYDECGEVAENWVTFDYKRDKLNELSDKLTEIVREWLKDNNNLPDFYKIENVRNVKVE